MYYSVCVVMIVAVRGCHLYLSKKFKLMIECTLTMSIILLNGPHDQRIVMENLNFLLEKS